MGARVVGDIASRRSLGDLLSDLTDGSAQLVRDEIRLARAETVESLLTLRRGAVWLAFGIGLALCAAAAGLTCLILVISRYLLDGRTWLAALIVAVVLAVIGCLCAVRGSRSLSGSSLAPRETATSIKETAEWLRHPTRSVVR
ncbi:MAG TPA: phage holin family protein [Gemmatimonadaceae bacterium]